MAKKLTQAQVEEKLIDLDEWGSNGKQVSKHFTFKNFAESLGFVNMVGDIAEENKHHPDIEFGWGYAIITLTTHDAKGLTDKDFIVAQAIDELNGEEA